MIEAAERAGVGAERRTAGDSTAVTETGGRSACVIEARATDARVIDTAVIDTRVTDACVIEAAVIKTCVTDACVIDTAVIKTCVIESTVADAGVTKGGTVGDVMVVVVHQVMPMPIGSPVAPPPAKASVQANPDSQTKIDTGAIVVGSRHSDPARIERQRFSVYVPGIVFRHVNDLRIRRRDRDRLSLVGHGLLRRAVQVAGLLRPVAHDLNGIEHTLRFVHVSLAERGGPGKILVHRRKHSRKLRERLYARIPWLRIYGLGECLPFQFSMLLYPAFRFHDLRGITRARNHLRDQRVRVESNRRDQLIQFVGRGLCDLSCSVGGLQRRHFSRRHVRLRRLCSTPGLHGTQQEGAGNEDRHSALRSLQLQRFRVEELIGSDVHKPFSLAL